MKGETMSGADLISPELKRLLRRLKLSPMLHTLPERIVLARQGSLPYQEFLEMILAEEVERRNQLTAQVRARKAKLDPSMQLGAWDESAKVTYDRQLWSELLALRFVQAHHNVVILGPVGVGKTHLASVLGHVACRRG